MEMNPSEIKTQEELIKAFEETKKQLLQSWKLAELGMMAGSIIHELKQPLFGIKAFAQLILEDLREDSPIRRQVELILKQSIVMEKIMGRVLEFSRRPKGEFQPVNINQPIEAALELISARLKGSNISIEKSLDPTLPKVMGDSNQLQQVSVNLINNARDAIDGVKKGIIGVKTSSINEGKNIEILVYDNGCGIPPVNSKRVFEPFYSTKEAEKGTGLGLFISREIINGHSGRIEIIEEDARAPEPRTVFRIVLPACY